MTLYRNVEAERQGRDEAIRIALHGGKIECPYNRGTRAWRYFQFGVERASPLLDQLMRIGQ